MFNVRDDVRFGFDKLAMLTYLDKGSFACISDTAMLLVNISLIITRTVDGRLRAIR